MGNKGQTSFDLENGGNRVFLRLLTVACLMLPAASVVAQESVSPFDDEMPQIEGMPMRAHYCQIVLTQNGSMNASVDRSTISSMIAGGQPGHANISTTNGRYSLYVDLPSAFDSAPPRGSDDVQFSALFRGSGDTNFGDTPHTHPVKMRRGETRITTNISAQKLSSTFPSGNYVASLTLRCE